MSSKWLTKIKQTKTKKNIKLIENEEEIQKIDAVINDNKEVFIKI